MTPKTPRQLNPSDFDGQDLPSLVEGAQKFCASTPTAPASQAEQDIQEALRLLDEVVPE